MTSRRADSLSEAHFADRANHHCGAVRGRECVRRSSLMRDRRLDEVELDEDRPQVAGTAPSDLSKRLAQVVKVRFERVQLGVLDSPRMLGVEQRPSSRGLNVGSVVEQRLQ